ncbi:MAG TPA: hypothetical protein VFZ33_05660 [Chitinophagaceae bacterium]
MKFTPTILNIYATIFLLVCIVFTIYNYAQLSEGEGWGVVGMIGLFGFGLLLLVGDLILRNIFKNKVTVNILGLIVAIIATILIFL